LPKSIFDDKKYRRSHARTIIQLLRFGATFSEAEVKVLIRGAAPLAAHAVLKKNARDYRAAMGVLLECVRREQADLDAVERNERPAGGVFINTNGNAQINVLTSEQIAKVSDDELFRLHQEALGLPLADPSEHGGIGEGGPSRNGTLPS
jgi:hypothetical protein